MVPNGRGTRCDNVRRCAHRLGSAGHGLQRATTAARLSPVTPNRSLPLQSQRIQGALLPPQPQGRAGADPQGPPPAPSQPPTRAPGLTPATCRRLPRSVLGGGRARRRALSWWLSFVVVVVIFNPHIVLDLRQRQQVGEMCLAL